MKIQFHFSILMVLIIAATSCKKDNYDAPSSTLSGNLMYNGDTVEVEVNQVPFQLYQPGFGKTGPIQQTFDQDGSYSALLFDGDYKFTIPGGQGPFMWKTTSSGAPDTIAVNLRGSQKMDIEVTPYYMVRNAQFAASGNSVTATCRVEQIITDANAKNIEQVVLYINRTRFVSGGDNNIANSSVGGGSITDPNNVSLSVTVPAISPAQNYVYARIGVKIAGVEDMIFSSVARVQL